MSYAQNPTEFQRGEVQSGTVFSMFGATGDVQAGPVVVTDTALDEGVILPSASTQRIEGVAQEGTVDGSTKAVSLATEGVVLVKADGAIANGAACAPSSAADHFGQVKASASGNRICGYAKTTAADGDFFLMELARDAGLTA